MSDIIKKLVDKDGNNILIPTSGVSGLDTALAAAGKIDDVKLDGTSIVTNKVANINIDAATLVHANAGAPSTPATVNANTLNGHADSYFATASDMSNALTKNAQTLTAAEKAQVLDNLGISTTMYSLQAGVDTVNGNAGTVVLDAGDIKMDSSDAQSPTLETKINELSGEKAVQTSVADLWVASTEYAVGDYVMYNGIMYKCNTANNDATFTVSKWTVCNVTNETNDKIDSLSSALVINATSSLDPTTTDNFKPVSISGNGKWSSGTGKRSYFYPRPDLCDHVSVTANSNNVAGFAMLKDDSAKSGDYPNYATGTSPNMIQAGQTQEFDVPSDCNYLYFYGYNGSTIYTPSSVTISGSAYTDKTLSITNKAADAKATGDSIRNIAIDVNHFNSELFPEDKEMPIDVLHRGLATSGYPENTMPAFKDAVDKGWKYFETDIRKTSDDVWVLLHDVNINRTARNADGTTISGTVNIADITYSQALEYDFGIYAGEDFAGTKIPTLDAFLNFCNKKHTIPVIEVKDSSISQTDADAVWAIIEKYQMQNRCFWTCSSFGGVEKFLAKNPYAPCIQSSASDWDGVDIGSLTPDSTKPYACKFMTGKNKVFHARITSGIATKELMDNLVDYLHYFGLYACVYCPTTQASIEACSDRLDMCTTQYLKYSDVKAESIEN